MPDPWLIQKRRKCVACPEKVTRHPHEPLSTNKPSTNANPAMVSTLQSLQAKPHKSVPHARSMHTQIWPLLSLGRRIHYSNELQDLPSFLSVCGSLFPHLSDLCRDTLESWRFRWAQCDCTSGPDSWLCSVFPVFGGRNRSQCHSARYCKSYHHRQRSRQEESLETSCQAQ